MDAYIASLNQEQRRVLQEFLDVLPMIPTMISRGKTGEDFAILLSDYSEEAYQGIVSMDKDAVLLALAQFPVTANIPAHLLSPFVDQFLETDLSDDENEGDEDEDDDDDGETGDNDSDSPIEVPNTATVSEQESDKSTEDPHIMQVVPRTSGRTRKPVPQDSNTLPSPA